MIKRFLALFSLLLLMSSCGNPFAYEENDWKQVTETEKGNYQAVYVDQNRIDCDEDSNCVAWVKMIFAQERQIPFSGTKSGQVSGYMLAKRVDSSVKFFCNLTKAQIISYQIYDKNDKLMDSKWIKGELMNLKRGTVYHDLWRHVCMKRRK